MTEKKRSCRQCEGPVERVRKDHRFEESGLSNVVLAGIEVDVCGKCGQESPRIPRLDELMDTIAAALISKPFELDGKEVRFLRKSIEANIESFACKLGVDRSHLSRIENGALAVSRQTDRLVRTLVLLHRPELLDKLSAPSSREQVLKLLEKIQPQARTVEVEVRNTPQGYNFELEEAA